MSAEPRLEVVPLRWYPARPGRMLLAPGASAVIGLVGLVDRTEGHEPFFKVYIGIARGFDGDQDAQEIAQWGAPILDEPMARLLAGPRWKKIRYAR